MPDDRPISIFQDIKPQQPHVETWHEPLTIEEEAIQANREADRQSNKRNKQ